jgi:hypothetical protein
VLFLSHKDDTEYVSWHNLEPRNVIVYSVRNRTFACLGRECFGGDPSLIPARLTREQGVLEAAYRTLTKPALLATPLIAMKTG